MGPAARQHRREALSIEVLAGRQRDAQELGLGHTRTSTFKVWHFNFQGVGLLPL